MAGNGKPLIVKRGQVIVVGGFELEITVPKQTILVRCLSPTISPWFHRPEGDDATIVLTTKSR